LEEENAKRKKRVADLSLDKRIAQDVLTKKSERLPGNGTPYGFCRNASRRVNAEAAVLRINRGWHRRQPSRNAQAFLRMRIKEIASVRKRYGYRRIHVLLLREGWKINHKRVYRLYREEGRNLRKPAGRKEISVSRAPEKGMASALNECWCMDFVSDQLYH